MKPREMEKKNDQMKGELMKSSNQNQKKRINTWWSREAEHKGWDWDRDAVRVRRRKEKRKRKRTKNRSKGRFEVQSLKHCEGEKEKKNWEIQRP